MAVPAGGMEDGQMLWRQMGTLSYTGQSATMPRLSESGSTPRYLAAGASIDGEGLWWFARLLLT
eukprot:1561314-Rhodomonas_salina.1